MKNKIVLIQIIFILIITMCNSVKAFEMLTSPTVVKADSEFNYELTINESIKMGNGHIEYDSSIMDFVSAETDKLEIREIKKGKIDWVYLDEGSKSKGTNQLNFKFKVKSLDRRTETNIINKNSKFVTFDNNLYEASDITHNLKVLGRDGVILPATGSHGMAVYGGLGILVMGSGIYYVTKKNN